jgi:PKD repeat protein
MGVALLALFLFIGGGAYILLNSPAATPDPNNNGPIAVASPTSSLAIYTPETPSPQPTPQPTPTPFFFSLDPGSFPPSDVPSPTLSSSVPVGPTPTPTRTQNSGPTPTPTRTAPPTRTPPPAGPRAQFSWSADALKAFFDNKSKGNGSLSYAWDFGDNKTSTRANPSHTYDQEGQYTVTLTVTDSFGLRDSQTKKVQVAEPPPTTEPPSPPPPEPTTAPPCTPSEASPCPA